MLTSIRYAAEIRNLLEPFEQDGKNWKVRDLVGKVLRIVDRECVDTNDILRLAQHIDGRT